MRGLRQRPGTSLHMNLGNAKSVMYVTVLEIEICLSNVLIDNTICEPKSLM